MSYNAVLDASLKNYLDTIFYNVYKELKVKFRVEFHDAMFNLKIHGVGFSSVEGDSFRYYYKKTKAELDSLSRDLMPLDKKEEKNIKEAVLNFLYDFHVRLEKAKLIKVMRYKSRIKKSRKAASLFFIDGGFFKRKLSRIKFMFDVHIRDRHFIKLRVD